MVLLCAMSIAMCLCSRSTRASRKGAMSFVWRYSDVSFWRRAFIIVLMSRPSRACSSFCGVVGYFK